MTSLPYSEPSTSKQCPVVWLHASDQPNFLSLEYLSHRLLQSGTEAQTVITTPHPDNHRQMVDAARTDLKIIETPAETQSAIQSFLNQYRPEFLIWSGGEFKASLLKAAAARGITMLLANSRAADFPSQRLRFLPDANRRALKGFEQYYAVDASAAHQLNRMGVSPSRIKIKGALQQTTPIPFLTKDLNPDLTEACMGRMVWLAACVTKTEAEIVLQAHRLVMRQSHRSLLILVPASKESEPEIVRMVQKLGLIHKAQSAGDVPDANTQAFICASSEDIHSWYALAPAAFLGQSLSAGKGGLDPYPPAAFGCALLYGPGVSSFMDRYSRLAEQGAARIIKDADSLGTAIVQITNPEQSAAMAYAAWNIISEGAELTDALVEQIVEHFDRSGT
jgi:3-deoxy-D-manno-octulosonic-acid transferase